MVGRTVGRWIGLGVLIALPLAGLLATGCGLFTFPRDGIKALATNVQCIKVEVALVDEHGEPLDDVTVAVVRRSLEANIILPGTYNGRAEDRPRTVSKVFKYETFGKCAVEMMFSKLGYGGNHAIYANVDGIAPTGGFFNQMPQYTCTNVSKYPHVTVVLRKQGGGGT